MGFFLLPSVQAAATGLSGTEVTRPAQVGDGIPAGAVPLPRPRLTVTVPSPRPGLSVTPSPRPGTLPAGPPRARPQADIAEATPSRSAPSRSGSGTAAVQSQATGTVLKKPAALPPPAPAVAEAEILAEAEALAAISPAAGPTSALPFAPMPPRAAIPEVFQQATWIAPSARNLPSAGEAAAALPPAPLPEAPDVQADVAAPKGWQELAADEARAEAALNILSDADVALYMRAFALQERGQWAEADGVIALLQDPVLLGHLREQRLMHPSAYRSTFAELQRWLLAYGDHPGADRVHRLAERRRPQGAALAAPSPPDMSPMDHVLEVRGQSLPDAPARPRPKAGNPAPASHLRPVRSDYYGGDWQKSLERATELSQRFGERLPEADWYAGLSAWRLKRHALAAAHFSALAGYASADPWKRSAGAYWAARAYLVLGQPGAAILRLQAAAAEPRTFYGLLASRRLGLDPEFGWSKLARDTVLVEALMEVPAVRRALALAQIGESDRAQAELTTLMDLRRQAGDILFTPLLTGLLGITGDARTAYRLARQWEQRTGQQIDDALFPNLPWEPRGGFTFDRALIFAFIRKESRFDPTARSPAGARGLMQLMPATARFVNGGSANLSRLLDDPAANIDLGQRYIRHLEQDLGLGPDLIRIVVAYNGGPGNLQRWDESTRHGGDPLLFIESLPSAETRNFVERVLTNFWIYRARFGQPSQGLDDLARGDWPRYVPMDEDIVQGNGG